MAKFYYNGVLLPEIPSDVLSEYPYCWIRKKPSQYDLLIGDAEWYYIPSDSRVELKASSATTRGLWYSIPIEGYEKENEWTLVQAIGGVGFTVNTSQSVFWSNHDIFVKDSETLYFEGTELIPEKETEETFYKISSVTLTCFGDQARRIGNLPSTEKVTTSQMINIFEGAGQGGSLEGLENGYDVMFYDENNEGLAFYSIKQGHSINPPEYSVKAWQTSDGTVITFPYTPSEDVIFYALNDTYASTIYEYFGVDSGVYPYLYLSVGTYMELMFYKDFHVSSNSIYNDGDYYKAGVKTSSTLDKTNIESVVAFATSGTLPSVTLKTSSGFFGISDSNVNYANKLLYDKVSASVDGFTAMLLD